MKTIQLDKRHSVKNFGSPYIIAEIGANHNGDIDLAKKMILSAKECGAHCVKFQSWTSKSLIAREEYERAMAVWLRTRNNSNPKPKRKTTKSATLACYCLKMNCLNRATGAGCNACSQAVTAGESMLQFEDGRTTCTCESRAVRR